MPSAHAYTSSRSSRRRSRQVSSSSSHCARRRPMDEADRGAPLPKTPAKPVRSHPETARAGRARAASGSPRGYGAGTAAEYDSQSALPIPERAAVSPRWCPTSTTPFAVCRVRFGSPGCRLRQTVAHSASVPGTPSLPPPEPVATDSGSAIGPSPPRWRTWAWTGLQIPG